MDRSPFSPATLEFHVGPTQLKGKTTGSAGKLRSYPETPPEKSSWGNSSALPTI